MGLDILERVTEGAYELLVDEDRLGIGSQRLRRDGGRNVVQHPAHLLLIDFQLSLGGLALSDVLDHSQEAAPPLYLHVHGADRQADPGFRPVRTHVAFVHLEAGNLAGIQPRRLIHL